MKEQQLNPTADYDHPIEKPFEELPDWFIERLNSRLTTKRFHKTHDTGANRGQRKKKRERDMHH